MCLSVSASAQQFGDCSSPIKTEWLPDGRTMKILEDYRYVDPSGRVWPALTGSIVDGASIPQFLWGPVGGPFEGKYRNASVVHDVACQARSDAWRAVHRMFLDAMLCSGVHRVRAYTMYYAVYQCGPRWGSDQGVTLCDPLRMLGLRGDLSRVSVLARQEPRMSVNELETLSPERLAGVEDPLTALRRALEGRAEVEETPSGVTITLPFGFDEARNANSSTAAAEIGAVFRDLPVKMTVEGHTDSVGTAEYNMALGQRRADTVAFGISASGFDRTSLAAVSMGEERPLADNVNPDTRQQNRRVVISISTEW